jgi:HPr kinase/phosphorylase
MSTTIYATSVVFCGHGLLLRGASGCGKSDLALRLMDAGGTLIADDHTIVEAMDGKVYAAPPESIRGLIEVRGVGLLQVPYCASARLHAVIDCVVPGTVERLPEARSAEFSGISLPLWSLTPFEASAVAKIRMLLQNPLNHG